MSKRSGRNSGSPPDSTNTGLATLAIWSIRSKASAVRSSVGPSGFCGTARQCWQVRLQALVDSQNTSRRDGVIERSSIGRTRMASATARSTASSV